MNEESAPPNSETGLPEVAFDPRGKIEAISKDETIIARTKRHPFGLFLVYLQTLVGLGLSLFVIIWFMPGVADLIGISDRGAESLFSVFSLIVITLGVVFLILATHIYWVNEIIFTNRSVTQVLQIGIFNKKISELSVADIEDVTAERSGIFPTFFNFGTLKIETAGEQNNFIFKYCPMPDAYASTLLDIRSQYRHQKGDKTH